MPGMTRTPKKADDLAEITQAIDELEELFAQLRRTLAAAMERRACKVNRS